MGFDREGAEMHKDVPLPYPLSATDPVLSGSTSRYEPESKRWLLGWGGAGNSSLDSRRPPRLSGTGHSFSTPFNSGTVEEGTVPFCLSGCCSLL